MTTGLIDLESGRATPAEAFPAVSGPTVGSGIVAPPAASTPKIDRLSFEKILQFPDYVRKLVADDEAYPVHMQLGPVNFCNHDCTFCYAARSMFEAQGVPRSRIDVPRLMEIMDEMKPLGLRAVTLVGSGEPTLHPRIDEIISGLGERGLDVGLFTNGSCISDRTLRAIADHQTFIRFSMTGASKRVHDLVHANDDFSRVVKNIERIVETRYRPFPTIGVQFVLASYSAEDVVPGTRLARSLGVDYFEIKPAYVAPNKPDQLPNTLSVSRARALMLEAKELEDERFKVYAKINQMEGVFAHEDDRSYDDCPGHKTNAVLEADFDLYLCSNHKVAEFKFGNLRTQAFRDVWHGPRRREILERLNVHHCEPRCRMDPVNRIVHEIRMGHRVIPLNPPRVDPALHPNFL